MEIDGWHIPPDWDDPCSYTRLWPIADTSFAIVAHHVKETSMACYVGDLGIVDSRKPPQQTWDFSGLAGYAFQASSLAIDGGHLAFFQTGWRHGEHVNEEPIIVVQLPSMAVAALRFRCGIAFTPRRIEAGSIVFVHDPTVGERRNDILPVVKVRLTDLEWTPYAARPRTRATAHAWFASLPGPRDLDLITRVKSLFVR